MIVCGNPRCHAYFAESEARGAGWADAYWVSSGFAIGGGYSGPSVPLPDAARDRARRPPTTTEYVELAKGNLDRALRETQRKEMAALAQQFGAAMRNEFAERK